MSLKSNVLKLCEERGIKVGTLEREAKLANGTIGKWTDDTTSNGATLSAIADYFDVTIDYLLDRKDYSAPEYADDQDLERLHKNPELRVLLSAGAHLTKDDIDFVAQMISKMRGND